MIVIALNFVSTRVIDGIITIIINAVVVFVCQFDIMRILRIIIQLLSNLPELSVIYLIVVV